MAALPADPPGALPRTEKTARVILEELVPATAAEFGARYLFENDPDGSYGFYNRLASEAADASTPEERDRLLRLYGGRWALAEEGEAHPLFRATTGFAVAGRRLVLFENPAPLPELRWAGRAWRRRSLSGTLELVRSARFAPETDIAFPGPRDEDPPASAPPSSAKLEIELAAADRAAARVDADAPGHVLFSRTFFPAWRARLDGAIVPVTVANARDLAVAVPAGRHRVEIEYDRRPFRRGVAIQAAALLAALRLPRRLGRGQAPPLRRRGRRHPEVHEQTLVDVRPASVQRDHAPGVVDRQGREHREASSGRPACRGRRGSPTTSAKGAIARK